MFGGLLSKSEYLVDGALGLSDLISTGNVPVGRETELYYSS